MMERIRWIWITRAETYFEVQRTSKEVRIQLAKLSMEGHTIQWSNLWKGSTSEATWLNFKEALVAQFGVGRLDNPYEELKGMRQTGTVEEYISEFELYSSQCGRLMELQFLGYFVEALRLDIRSRVRMHKPKDKYSAMQLAWDVEVEILALKGDDDDAGRKGKGMGRGHQEWSRFGNLGHK